MRSAFFMCKRFHAEEGAPLSDEITFVVEIIIDRWAYFERPLIIGSLFSFERAFAVFVLGKGLDSVQKCL